MELRRPRGGWSEKSVEEAEEEVSRWADEQMGR
jgi:hypothetical protein